MTLSQRISGFLLLVVFSLAWAVTTNASGEVDTSFGGYLTNLPGGIVNRIVVQPDGKVLAAGNFRFAGGCHRNGSRGCLRGSEGGKKAGVHADARAFGETAGAAPAGIG